MQPFGCYPGTVSKKHDRKDLLVDDEPLILKGLKYSFGAGRLSD